jgi:hypothetical protein
VRGAAGRRCRGLPPMPPLPPTVARCLARRRARKVDVSDKPGSHQWTSEEYAGNGAAAHARKLQVCPFAVDEDDSGSRPSSARGSSRAGSEAGNSQQSYHHAAAVLPSGKVCVSLTRKGKHAI